MRLPCSSSNAVAKEKERKKKRRKEKIGRAHVSARSYVARGKPNQSEHNWTKTNCEVLFPFNVFGLWCGVEAAARAEIVFASQNIKIYIFVCSFGVSLPSAQMKKKVRRLRYMRTVFSLLRFCLRIDHLYFQVANAIMSTAVGRKWFMGHRQFDCDELAAETLRTPTSKMARDAGMNAKWFWSMWAVKVVKVPATHRRRHPSLFSNWD